MIYTISWMTRDYTLIKRVKDYFGIENMTVNKISQCVIHPDNLEKFLEGERRGIYRIQCKIQEQSPAK